MSIRQGFLLPLTSKPAAGQTFVVILVLRCNESLTGPADRHSEASHEPFCLIYTERGSAKGHPQWLRCEDGGEQDGSAVHNGAGSGTVCCWAASEIAGGAKGMLHAHAVSNHIDMVCSAGVDPRASKCL